MIWRTDQTKGGSYRPLTAIVVGGGTDGLPQRLRLSSSYRDNELVSPANVRTEADHSFGVVVIVAPRLECEIVRFPPRPNEQRFSERDMRVLRHWCGSTCRIAVWDTELGSFAMLYPDGSAWATYALARESGRIRLWNSVTLVDIGIFDCVADALGAIPALEGEFLPTVSNVIPFPIRR